MDHLLTLQKAFSDQMFCIPDYQRGYAWDKTQWEDLLEDLEWLTVV